MTETNYYDSYDDEDEDDEESLPSQDPKEAAHWPLIVRVTGDAGPAGRVTIPGPAQ